MNKFEQPFSDEEEKEIEEMEKQRIKESDDFKEKGVSYNQNTLDREEISDEEVEKIIKEIEVEKAEKLKEEKKKIQAKFLRDIEESRRDQKDDICDLYKR